MSPTVPAAQPVQRLTVPLFDTSFTTAERRELDGRLALAPGITVARLTRTESTRIRQALLLPPPDPLYRIEIETTPLAGHGLSNAQAEDVIRRTLALLCCAVRFAPRWHAAVVDEHNGSVWVRKRHIFTAGGGSPRHSYVRLDRAKTWGQLIRHWSLLGLDPVVDLALDLLYESVAERQTRPGKSFLLAITAVDVLLGCATADDAAHRRAPRAAALLVAGPDSEALANAIHSWDNARRQYLDRGVSVEDDTRVRVHRFLMRALPSMARFMAVVGGDYHHAIAWLDAVGNRPVHNHPLARNGGERWWDYVDLASIVVP